MNYQRTYLDKCATIVKGSEVNTGLNPVADLLWGRNVSRFLIHFDHTKIKGMVEDKIYPDLHKLRHTLKITNAGSLDMSELHKTYASQIDGEKKKRATSFDLVYFLIPSFWDCGKGFDYTKNYITTEYYDKKSYDYTLYQLKEGANWYSPRLGYSWQENNKYSKSTDELFTFSVKADRRHIGSQGGIIVFTYYCEANDAYVNANLKLVEHNPSPNFRADIGQAIFYARNGQICQTEEHKIKYCTYVQVAVTIPKNTEERNKTYNFKVKLSIDNKEFKSNVYSIHQEYNGQLSYPKSSDGIYSTQTLATELEKFENGEESIVIGKQHFDLGTENVNIDITDTFNKFIEGAIPNYGIGIAFSPDFEDSESLYENYIGLLTNKTNSFFEPYVETVYMDAIQDDRPNFVLGKNNKLYLYSTIGGNLENLDQLPTCTVEDKEYEVKQCTKGIYYIDITLPISSYNAPAMLYDTWDGIIYHGQDLGAVELDFATISPNAYFNIGTNLPDDNEFKASVYGVKNNEHIQRGDKRKINFLVKQNYTTNKAVAIDGIEARLYVKDGKAECDAIPYQKVNKTFNEMYLMLDTSILIPNTYYMDVKITYGMEDLIHHEIVNFTIVDDTSNRYE